MTNDSRWVERTWEELVVRLLLDVPAISCP
jgi:hypothetical protein